MREIAVADSVDLGKTRGPEARSPGEEKQESQQQTGSRGLPVSGGKVGHKMELWHTTE